MILWHATDPCLSLARSASNEIGCGEEIFNDVTRLAAVQTMATADMVADLGALGAEDEAILASEEAFFEEESPIVAEVAGSASAEPGVTDASGEDVVNANQYTENTPAPQVGCSFPGNTGVATLHGLVSIATLQVGDSVLAEDPETGKVEPEKIEAVIAEAVKPLMQIQMSDGSTLSVTSNHPFYVDSGPDITTRQWVQADDLRVGDHLRTEDGHDVRIIALRYHTGYAHVYTLTVANDHTYFVGDGTPVLVHNCGEDVSKSSFNEIAAVAAARRALRRLYGRNYPAGNRNYATAPQGPIYSSGGSGGVSEYQQAQPAVMAESARLGIPIPAAENPRFDEKFPFFSTHAEQYVSVEQPNQPIGSLRIPCVRGCRWWFSQLAAKRDYPQVVADPTGSFIFYPDGTVKRIYAGGQVRVGMLVNFSEDGSYIP